MIRAETSFLQKKFFYLRKKSGIYQLFIGKRKYIGSSIDLYERIKDHYYDCINGTHSNSKVQRTYNKYKTFDVRILAMCPPEYCIKLEQWFLNNTNIQSDLNICKVAGSTLGRRLSEETKRKIGEKNKNTKWTEEAKQRLSTAIRNRHEQHRNKRWEKIVQDLDNRKILSEDEYVKCRRNTLTEQDVIKIIKLLKNGNTIHEVVALCSTKYTTICDIIKGRTWRHVSSIGL